MRPEGFDGMAAFRLTRLYRAAMADRCNGGPVNRPRAADDFETIRARIDELRRERGSSGPDPDGGSGTAKSAGRESAAERRRRERMEGWPPPWVPTIFVRNTWL
jgi:hypothetical protein